MDTPLYTVDVLHSRKAKAEEMAHKGLGVPSVLGQGPAPLKFVGTHEPGFVEIENYYQRQGYETMIVLRDRVQLKVLEGWAVALDPGSGHEVWLLFPGTPREEQVFMVRRQPDRGNQY